MKGKCKVLDFFPVTVTGAVYLDGTNITLKKMLDNIVDGYTTCSLLGMVPESEKDSELNYNILLGAIKSGINVIVDNTYYIKSVNGDFNANNEVNNICITGDGKSNSRLIGLGGKFFNAKGNVLIENLNLDCSSSPNINFFIYLDTPEGNDIIIRNSYISGNIRVLSTNIPQEFDFQSKPSHINNLKIINNEFFDVYNSSGSMTIFKCTDTPITNTYIENNIVTNFSYVFFDNSITNGSPNEDYIYENTKNTYIKNNRVTNLDDYDPKKKNSNPSTYFCFTLLESIKCECIGNSFEGFKIIDAPNTVVYDNYFSVSELIYESNTWKNIVNFTPNIDYLDIMKSKNGSTKHAINRFYRKNKYIVEKEYADKFQQDRNLLIKRIDTYEAYVDNVIIEDNFFDMYILNSNRYKKIKNYFFNKNTIKTYTMDYERDTQSFIGIVDIPDYNEQRQLLFTNNIVICKNAPQKGSKVNSLITNYTGSNNNVSVVFENNYIEMHDLFYVMNDERSSSDILTNPLNIDVKFNNNTIKVKNINRNLYLFTKSFNNLRSFNNNNFDLDMTNKKLYIFYEPYTVPTEIVYELPVCMNTNINLSQYTTTEMDLRLLPLKGLNKSNYDVTFNIKRLTSKTFEDFDFNFKLRSDESSNTLECYGLDNVKGEHEYTLKQYTLDGNANKVYGNLYIRQDNKKGTQTINVNVSNAQNDKDIMLSLFTANGVSKPEKDIISITMNIFKL